MSVSQFNFPTTIRFGAGVVKELPDYLKEQHQPSADSYRPQRGAA